jgi:PAS domain S-box-containing protein
MFLPVLTLMTKNYSGKIKKRSKEDSKISLDIDFFENFDDAVVIYGVDEVRGFWFESINKAAEKIYGLKADAIGKFIVDLLPPKENERLTNNLKKCLTDGKPFSFSREIEFHNGIRYFHITFSPFTDHKGEIYRIVSISRDASESRKLENSLTNMESKYSRLFNSMMDAFVSTDIKGNIIEVNESYLQLLGYTENEVKQKTYKDLTPKKWHELESMIVDEQIIPMGYSGIYEKEYFHKSGHIIPVELRAFLLKDENGEPSAIWAIVRDISSRKKAEEKLEKEIAFSNILINASPAFIVGISTKGQTVFINESFLKATGYELNDVIGKDYNSVFVPESEIADLSDIFKQIIEKKVATINENYIRKKNGELMLVEWHGRHVLNDKNEVEFFIGIGLDINERKKAESIKEETENRLKTLVDIVPFGSHIWELKANGDLIFLGENLSSKRILGVDSDHLIGMKIEDAFPYHKNTTVPDTYRKVASTGIPFHSEDLSYSDNRISGAFELHAMQVAPNKMVVFFMDITERKKSEEAVRLSETRYKRLHESIMDAFITIDAEGFMKDSNKVFLNMMGYTLAELSKLTYADITPEKGRSVEKEFVSKQISEKGYTDVFEKEYRRKDGSVFPAEIRVFLLKNEHGKPDGMIGIVRDITMRKQLEKQLQNHVKDLERSNRELEQFAYIASHDLQEPLRMVSSFTQLLAQKYKDKLDENAMEYIHYAVDGANRMQRLINDLLAYSRVQTKGKEFFEVDMHIALGQALSMLSQTISNRNALITNDELPTVLADEGQMVQLFLNLISNAVKFCTKNPIVHISSKENDDNWVFSVKDNGIGIQPQYFAKIFQIFQRLHTKEEFSGTGIGLALCQRIIERHGGKIWLESMHEKGTVFYFSLPKVRSNQI